MLLRRRLRILPLLLGFSPAFAASDWKAATGLNLSETYTDNIALAATGAQSALITQATPSIHLDRQGKNSAYVYYGLNELLYDSGRNQLTQNLDAGMRLEPVTGVFKVAGNARIEQSDASQFGPAASNAYTTNSNRVETRSASLTPSLHNEFSQYGLITDASLGLNYASAGGGTLASSSDDLRLGLHNGTRPEKFSYLANYDRSASQGAAAATLTSDNYQLGYAALTRTRVFVAGGNHAAQALSSLQGSGSHYTVGGVNWSPSHFFSLTGTAGRSDGSATAGLSADWAPSPRLRLAASAGRRNASPSYSLSGNWTPSVLTSVSGSAQKNFDAGTFGVGTAVNGLSSYGYTAYALNFSHRVRRAVLGLNYSESVVQASQQLTQSVNFPYYLCGGQFQPIITGQPMPSGCVPVSVAIPVTQLLNQTTYNKNWAGTLNFSLGRSAFAFTLNQSRVQALNTTTGDSRQTGASANWTRAISSRTSTSLGSNWSQAEAVGSVTRQSHSWSLFGSLAHQLSPHASGSVSVRHTQQGLSGGDILENSVIAQIGMTF